MALRSTAFPSRLPSRAVPWILTRSTVAGLAPGTRGGTSVFTWAASGVARARLATSVFTLMRPLTVEPRSP